jgi:hypothetical protein
MQQALGNNESFENVSGISKLAKEPVAAPSASIEASQPQAQALVAPEKALVSRYLDFWLLGGFSVVLYFLMLFLSNSQISSYHAVARHITNIGPVFTMLTLVVNFPHFAWSYKFAYSQSPKFVVKNYQQLILAPAILIAFLATAYYQFNASVGSQPVSQVLSVMFGVVGMDTRISLYPNYGMQMLALMMLFQYAIVGWHYVKQTFGVMMTYAGYTSYPLSQRQRDLIRWNLFGIWWLFFAKMNTGIQTGSNLGVTYHSLNLPEPVMNALQLYLYGTLAAVVWFVFYDIYKKKKVLPNPNMLIAYAAMYLWFVPLIDVPNYFPLVVPFAHSLQYLAFVYKVESKAQKETAGKHLAIHATMLVAAVVLFGYFFIEVLPGLIDEGMQLEQIMQIGFFTVAFQIFINVHHYFIDNCIWQAKNKEIKKYIFA